MQLSNVSLWKQCQTTKTRISLRLFSRFAGECSNTLLCVMHELGYCKRNQRLVDIILAHLEMREAFAHKEEDAGSGHIARFLRRNGGTADAVATACHIRNRCPSSSLGGLTPYEKWTGELPKLDHLRTFGAKVFVLDKDPTKDKFAPRSAEGVLIGYPRESKGYRVWTPEEQKAIVARDVKFLEAAPEGMADEHNVNELRVDKRSGEDAASDHLPKPAPQQRLGALVSPVSPPTPDHRPAPLFVTGSARRARGRPRLVRTGGRGRPRKVYQTLTGSEPDYTDVPVEIINNELDDDVFLDATLPQEPLQEMFAGIAEVFLREAMSSEEREEWKDAILSEVESLVKNDTWDVIKKPEGQKSVGCRVVLTNKYATDGSIERQKARIVAKEFSQRLLLALAAELNLTIWQFDVVTAYLNGNLEEEVIMDVPDILLETLDRLVLEKSITLEMKIRAETMIKILRSGGDACRLKKALYVVHSSEVKQSLMEDFEIKDLGIAKRCLGLEITQEEDAILLTQKGYTLDVLARYGMEQCNPISTPSELHSRDTPEIPAGSEAGSWLYRELIGALMYLAVATRPDIANTVFRLAQFNNNPRKRHWLAAKRVLRYLAGTTDLGLLFFRTYQSLTSYSDADWGDCAIDRRSFTGYAFLLGGAAISWKSQKQRTVALSSTEAEYVSMTEAFKEGLYLRSLLTELGLGRMAIYIVVLYIDNRGAQYLAHDHMYHHRTKHINIRYHFLRQSVAEGLVTLEHVPTNEMVADILTKALPATNH
ncbi:Retrovirus-related Pol polyprotein from transposon TNT 1-94 [Temnothorax longispinosus]|uniref:Retrovirus-related Pol polyprotein from transposon TNT 1-94 n=1 Tax=Temnothorax longispinosus TaxID=300112 RepID=A0A4S2KS30_9HYME|nr:Retrovirus-related Pol polyprotein from transposon TNT 1-94 [Temnothorax longispinosus]